MNKDIFILADLFVEKFNKFQEDFVEEYCPNGCSLECSLNCNLKYEGCEENE